MRFLPILMIVGFFTGSFFWYRAIFFDLFVPAADAAAEKKIAATWTPSAMPAKIGVPVRIKIPSIDVDAAVEAVALTKAGSMGVPKAPMDTGWYKFGPRPGERGSATMAGHVDWYNGASGVFKNLSRVMVGDKITVQDDAGGIKTFIVRETRTYGAAVAATDVFISKDGGAHLNLITCDGMWDKKANQYTKRLVVFADLVTK